MFQLISTYNPAGDQPEAIKALTDNFSKGIPKQVLLGVTGSGKTFTMANVIQNVNKPTLVISHNKTLAAQLYQEFRDFFPNNAVEYFVSYYDYYQPESYIPSTDTYIEKEATINKEIDKLRLKATASLMSRKDVIIVASVSCIYNLGSPVSYKRGSYIVKKGPCSQKELMEKLIDIYYERNDTDFKRGSFRGGRENIDLWPSYEDVAIRFNFFGNEIKSIEELDPISSEVKRELDTYVVFPAKHYVTDSATYQSAFLKIEDDLTKRVKELKRMGKNIEAYRLQQKTKNDLEMISEIGYCNGIENYSRYFENRKAGQKPYCLIDFFPDDFLLVVDESHITLPQIRGMYNGDFARKNTLIDYGFRLPSALDNRPLKFNEFMAFKSKTVYLSATPNEFEIDLAKNVVVEQLIRPTGICDPLITILPSKNQIADLVERIKQKVQSKQRVLVTTLTKRMAEELAIYLEEKCQIKVAYLHSDIKTLERSEILDRLRKGTYDVLIGINLLREGLDLPEVSLVAVLDADKEGFLRSSTSLIQTMGRASRHIEGNVVLYADNITGSIKAAVSEVERRRTIQLEFNKKHSIIPKSISKPIRSELVPIIKGADDFDLNFKLEDYEYKTYSKVKKDKTIKGFEKLMKFYAENLDFEKAALIRDKIRELKKI